MNMFLKYATRFSNVITLLVLAQVAFFLALIWKAQSLYLPVEIALIVLSAACALYIASGETNAVYRLAWAVAIMFLPIFGGVIYVYYNRRNIGRLIERSYSKCYDRALLEKLGEEEALERLRLTDIASFKTASYLANSVGFSPCLISEESEFFPMGEDKLARLIVELKKAEKYIFLEYFIIEEGAVWDTLYEILKAKAREGVDVRLIYDGAGCLYPLPWKFRKNLEKHGIKVGVFNPVRPLVSARLTVRNHRKIAVIDGKKAFCGGLNLADQYVNLKEMFGRFKDSAVMVDGGAAWNATLMFLSMWEFIKRAEPINYGDFKPDITPVSQASPTFETRNPERVNAINCYQPIKVGASPEPRVNPAFEAGYASPMLDVPHDKITVSEQTFINLISRAEEYVYITTPYLMCGGEILSALYAAARSGTDVRIIAPFVADKALVSAVTKSYYRALLENKVRIFEYVPGFIHAKNLIADGKRAMVGTVNLDYISLYMHYECGLCFFGGKVVEQIDQDFKLTLSQCREVTLSQVKRWSFVKKAVQRVCRLLAPFL